MGKSSPLPPGPKVRIVKFDAHNYAVQRLVEREGKDPVWENEGYFGDKLRWAVESALFVGVPVGSTVTAPLLRKVFKGMIAETAAVMAASPDFSVCSAKNKKHRRTKSGGPTV